MSSLTYRFHHHLTSNEKYAYGQRQILVISNKSLQIRVQLFYKNATFQYQLKSYGKTSKTCITCLDKVLIKDSPSTNQPWISNSVRRLCCKKKRYFRYAQQSSFPEHWERYQQCKKECQRECRSAYNKFITNLVKGNSVTKKFWSYVKSKKKD